MSEQKRHYRLGLFVLLAIMVSAGLLIAFGAGKWLTPNVQLETYFDESIQGIDVGSKIRYRGVIVGQVSSVGFTYTNYQLDQPPAQRKQYVMVIAKVQPTLFGGNKLSFPDQNDLNREIAKGLRTRLTPQGLTGTSYLEIDFSDPVENPAIPLEWTPEHLYIPSAKSTVKQFVDGAQDLMLRLQRIDIEGTFSRFNQLVETTEKQVKAVPVDRIAQLTDQLSQELSQKPISKVSAEAFALLAEARTSNRQLQALLGDPALQSAPGDLAASAKRARAILENPEIPQAISRLNQTLGRIDQLVGSRDQAIAAMLDNLNDISANLKALSESAQRHPAGLLLGAPPKSYEPPR